LPHSVLNPPTNGGSFGRGGISRRYIFDRVQPRDYANYANVSARFSSYSPNLKRDRYGRLYINAVNIYRSNRKRGSLSFFHEATKNIGRSRFANFTIPDGTFRFSRSPTREGDECLTSDKQRFIITFLRNLSERETKKCSSLMKYQRLLTTVSVRHATPDGLRFSKRGFRARALRSRRDFLQRDARGIGGRLTLTTTVHQRAHKNMHGAIYARVYTRPPRSSVGGERRVRSCLERDSKGARRGQAWATRDHHDKSSGQTSVQFISL